MKIIDRQLINMVSNIQRKSKIYIYIYIYIYDKIYDVIKKNRYKKIENVR